MAIPARENKNDSIESAEKVALSAVSETQKNEYLKLLRIMNKRKTDFSKSEVGSLIIKMENAFENSAKRTAAEKSAALVSRSKFLQASEFIRKNSNTALMVIGTAVVIVGAGTGVGAAPVVLAIVAGAMGSTGALQVALQNVTRTTALNSVFEAQNKKAIAARQAEVEKQKNEEAQKFIDKCYNEQPLVQKNVALNSEVAELQAEIVRLEKRKEILGYINILLDAGNQGVDLKAIKTDEKYKMAREGVDRILQELKSDKSFLLSYQSEYLRDDEIKCSNFIEHADLKDYLEVLKTDVEKNTQSETKNERKAKILNKIDELSQLLEPEKQSELLPEQFFSDVKGEFAKFFGLKKANPNVPKEFQAFINENETKIKELMNMFAVDINLNLKSSSPKQMTRVGGTRNLSAKAESLSFQNLEHLKRYLETIKTNVDSEVSQLQAPSNEEMLADYKTKLNHVLNERKEFMDENQKEIVELKERLNLALPELRKLMDKYNLTPQWATDLLKNIKNLAPTGLLVSEATRVFLEGMEIGLKMDDIFAGPTSDIVSKEALVNKLTNESLLAGKNARAAESLLATSNLAFSTPNITIIQYAFAIRVTLEAQRDILSNQEYIRFSNIIEEAQKDSKTVGEMKSKIDDFVSVEQKKDKYFKESVNNVSKQLSALKSRVSVSDIKKIASMIPDIKSGVSEVDAFLKVAQKRLEKASAGQLSFLDWLRLESVCSEDPAFQAPPIVGVEAKLISFFKPSKGFDEMIKYLENGTKLQSTFLELMDTEINSENVKNNTIALLKVDSLNETVANINKKLQEINIEVLSNALPEKLKGLEIYFPPDDNTQKERFVLMADEKKSKYFNDIVEMRKTLISINNALKNLNARDLDELKRSIDDMGSIRGKYASLGKALDSMTKALEKLEAQINKEQKNIELQDKLNKFREPYVNIFSGLDEVSGEKLKERLLDDKVIFADVLSVLTETNVQDFINYLKLKGIDKEPLVVELNKIYPPFKLNRTDEERTKLEVERIAFLENAGRRKELEALKKLFPGFLRDRSLMFTDLKYPNEVQGEYIYERNFTKSNDFLLFLKENEKLYYTQNILGVQNIALMTTIRNSFKNEIHLMNVKLDRVEIIKPENKAIEKEVIEATSVTEAEIVSAKPLNITINTTDTPEVSSESSPLNIHLNSEPTSPTNDSRPPTPDELPKPEGLFTAFKMEQSEKTTGSKKKPPPPPPIPSSGLKNG